MARIITAHIERPAERMPMFDNDQTLVESDDGRHYVVSSSHDPSAHLNETMIFVANGAGQITDWTGVETIVPRDHVEGIRVALNGYEARTAYFRVEE